MSAPARRAEPYRPTAMSIRVLGVIIAAYEKISGVSGYLRPEPRIVDRRLEMRVAEVRPEATDVVSLRLEPVTQAWVPHWDVGAHIDVELPGGGMRQYSLCGDPSTRDHYRIAVRRIADGGGGSRAMHDLRVGDRIVLHGPRNAFPFITVERYLFVAGGIGITPILPMVRDAAARGADWTFVYTGRSREAMPFLDDVLALDPERVHVWPDDEYGVPDGAKIVALAPDGAALYTCGPPAMIDAIRAEMPAENVGTLHYERFSAPPVVGGEPFELVLARSGHVVQVDATETALTAVRRVLPDVAYSCRQGFCGTCVVPVVGGAQAPVLHRDRCLTAVERENSMTLCVSRASDRVTLDL